MLLIDDFRDPDSRSRLGTTWRLVTDRVMGGVSSGQMALVRVDSRRALCLKGKVSLEKNGGFVQLSLDLSPSGYFDAGDYSGVRAIVLGNGEDYNLHLKTADVRFPWQSYRSSFSAGNEWREIRLAFKNFAPHRIEAPLDINRLSRLGLLAIGRSFSADLCIAELGFY